MVTDEWRRVGTRNGGRRDQPLLIASHSRIIYTEALMVRDLTQGSLHTWNSHPRMSVPSSKSLPETACPSSQMALCLSGFHRYLPWGFSHFPIIIFSLGLQELFSNALGVGGGNLHFLTPLPHTLWFWGPLLHLHVYAFTVQYSYQLYLTKKLEKKEQLSDIHILLSRSFQKITHLIVF